MLAKVKLKKPHQKHLFIPPILTFLFTIAELTLSQLHWLDVKQLNRYVPLKKIKALFHN
jgi:hypothetical protein